MLLLLINYYYLLLCLSQIYGCDFIVSATGVAPLTDFLGPRSESQSEVRLTDSGEILVDSCMRTSVPNVCAAGDCCWVEWKGEGGGEEADGSSNSSSSSKDSPSNIHWFQMKLWNQVQEFPSCLFNWLVSRLLLS